MQPDSPVKAMVPACGSADFYRDTAFDNGIPTIVGAALAGPDFEAGGDKVYYREYVPVGCFLTGPMEDTLPGGGQLGYERARFAPLGPRLFSLRGLSAWRRWSRVEGVAASVVTAATPAKTTSSKRST